MLQLIDTNRAHFHSGGQELFLKEVGQKIPFAKITQLCKCSPRTVRDWRRGKFSMPMSVVNLLAKKARLPVPKKIRIRDLYAHTSKAGKKGYEAIVRKYGSIPGNELHRNKKWQEWWNTIGKYQLSHKGPRWNKTKPIQKPKKDARFAEYIGIMMGDGGLSRYQATITLHHIDDLLYSKFVIKLIQDLLDITPSVYHAPKYSVRKIVISRVELVRHLHSLGLPLGNKIKQALDIPLWIKKNRSFSRACVRGLVDTDGCVFTHRYRSKRRMYSYKKLQFTSRSALLRKSVAKILSANGMSPRCTRYDVRLDSKSDVERFFLSIGTHNPKHWKRYKSTVG